jgi:pilus assembly protein Flp/PilA
MNANPLLIKILNNHIYALISQSAGNKARACDRLPVTSDDIGQTRQWRNAMRKVLKDFASDVRGVTLIEYGLIASLIAVTLAGVLGRVGTNLNTVFQTISTKV